MEIDNSKPDILFFHELDRSLSEFSEILSSPNSAPMPTTDSHLTFMAMPHCILTHVLTIKCSGSKQQCHAAPL